MKSRANHNILIIFILTLHTLGVCSQKSMDYTQYMFNNLLENPAYAGRKEISNFTFLTRHQWIGIEGAPSAYILTLHTPLRNKQIGTGIDFKQNTIGPFHVTGLFMNYAYTLKISNSANISMGLQGGGNIYEINLENLTLINPGDPLFQQDIDNILLPNFGCGFHLKYHDYYFDFSIPMMIKNKLAPKDLKNQDRFSKESRIYIFGGGASVPLSGNIELLPSFFTRFSKGIPASIDVTLAATLGGIFGFGMNYRMGSSLSGLLNYRLSNGLRIGYAYDASSGAFGGFIPGTHELLIGYDFEFSRQKNMSPRRF